VNATKPLWATALSATLALPILAPASPAQACGNSVRHKMSAETRQVQQAEVALANGKHQKAIKLVQKVDRNFFSVQRPPVARSKSSHGLTVGLKKRAQRIAALAIARSYGAVKINDQFNSQTPEAKQAAIAWSVLILRMQLANSPNNTGYKADLAEGLMAQATGSDEAYVLLRKLADDDLMPSSYGYANLARIEDRRGNTEARDAALKRCSIIALDAHVCQIGKTS